MTGYLEKLPWLVEEIRSIKETLITNIVLIGQIPSPTFREKQRTIFFMERLAEYQVDECTTDVFTVISFRIKWIGWLVKLYFKPLSKIIIKQDVAMLAAQQQNIKKFGGPEFRVCEPDLLYTHINEWRAALKDGRSPPASGESRDVRLRI